MLGHAWRTGGCTLLKAETISLVMSYPLPDGVYIRFPQFGKVLGKGYGLAGAITISPSPLVPLDAIGEFQWDGIGDTHGWISPKASLAGILMTQRKMAIWHPFLFEFNNRSANDGSPAWLQH